MNSNAESVIKNIQSLLIAGDIDSALDKLFDFVSKIDSILANEVLILKQRYFRIESGNRKGILSFENYQLEINKISASILYLTNQIPDSSTKKIKQNKAKSQGRLLHDIPLKMPIDLETKCIVRIAENEEILLNDYQLSTDSVIEEIPISKVMEVELIDFSNNQNFNIRSFNSNEQTIEQKEYTQWLFFVKPVNSGTHTLYLKVSIVQEIRGKERKKEIVLERKVNVVVNPNDASNNRNIESWHDTNIIISTPVPKEKILNYRGSRKIKFFGFTLNLAAALIIVGTAVAATAFTTYIIVTKDNDNIKIEGQPKKSTFRDSTNDFNLIVFEDSTENEKANTKSQVDEVDFQKEESKKSEVDSGVKNSEKVGLNKNRQEQKVSTKKRLNTSDEEKKKVPNKKQSIETQSERIAYMKKHGYNIVDELIPKGTSRIGGKIFIEINIIGFKKNEIEFILDKKHKLSPTNRDGNIFYFEQLKSTNKELSFMIVDKDSGNSIERKLKGNTNYKWIVKRTVGSIGID